MMLLKSRSGKGGKHRTAPLVRWMAYFMYLLSTVSSRDSKTSSWYSVSNDVSFINLVITKFVLFVSFCETGFCIFHRKWYHLGQTDVWQKSYAG